jgi:hypothetical protein
MSIWFESQLGSFLISSSIYNNLVSDFSQLIENDLKEFSVKRSQFRRNFFHQIFLRISKAMTTRPAYVLETLEHARNPSIVSDFSTSSNEDKNEETSKQILFALLDNIASFPGFSSVQFGGLEYTLEMYAP